jgi:hypothetical protein
MVFEEIVRECGLDLSGSLKGPLIGPVKTAVCLQVPLNAHNLLIIWVSISFLSRTYAMVLISLTTVEME